MLWPVLFALMAVVPVWLARAASVELDAAMDPGLPEEEVRQIMQRLAVEKLVRGEMARLNLDVAAYDKALEEKFGASFAEQEKRLLEEWTKTGKTPEEQAPLLAQEKARARERFLGLGSLLKSFSVKRLGAHPDTVGTWQITLEGEVDEALLSLHVQRLQQVGSKAFRHLWINTQVRPENFSWEDLQLTRAADFVTPIEAEWLKWFQQNPSADVESVVLCGEACQKSLAIWQTIDEKSLAGSLPAEFSDSLLMSVTITLHR